MFLYPRLHGSVHKIELQNKRKCLSQQFVLASAKFSHQGSGQSRRVHFPQGKPWGAVLRCGWENLVFAPCAGLCGLWVSLCGLNRWVFGGCTHRKDQTVCTRSKEPRRNPSILSYNHHPVFSRAKWSKEEDQTGGVPLVPANVNTVLLKYRSSMDDKSRQKCHTSSRSQSTTTNKKCNIKDSIKQDHHRRLFVYQSPYF